MAGADGKNHLGSRCSNPKRENCSLKQDDSIGGEDEWVNSGNIWKMESIGHDGLVAGAIPREMHLWMFAREFYLCVYKNNLIQKIPRRVSTFSLHPFYLACKWIYKEMLPQTSKGKKKVDSEAYSKSINRSVHHGDSQAEVVKLHGVSMSCDRFCPRLSTQGCLYSI